MLIYNGYYYFEKTYRDQGRIRGKIISIDCDKGRGILGVTFDPQRRYDIIVSNKDPLEEQVKTVLHELAHIGLEHDLWVKDGVLSHIDLPYNEMEQKMETETLKFYQRNPPLVDKIRRMLIAYTNQSNETTSKTPEKQLCLNL